MQRIWKKNVKMSKGGKKVSTTNMLYSKQFVKSESKNQRFSLSQNHKVQHKDEFLKNTVTL